MIVRKWVTENLLLCDPTYLSCHQSAGGHNTRQRPPPPAASFKSACMKSPHCSGVAGHLPTCSSSSPRLSLTFAALTTLSRADYQFGWLQGIAKQLKGKYF